MVSGCGSPWYQKADAGHPLDSMDYVGERDGGKWLVFSLSFSALHWNDGMTPCFPECPGLDCY